MRFMIYALVSLGAAGFGADPQTKGKSETKAGPQAKKEAGPVQGFAVAPMVLKDEGCARDYVRAFQVEGVELRKRLADLKTYGCIDTSAAAIFSGVSTVRKNFAVERGHEAYFRYVTLTIEPARMKRAAGSSAMLLYSGSQVYEGWIPDANFYELSGEAFDQAMAQGDILFSIRHLR